MSLHARYRPAEAAWMALVAVTGAIAIYSAIYAVASAPYWDWNAGKLAPLAALTRGQPRGYRLYQDPHDGVMTAWIYGPVPALIFAPSTLFDRPTPMIMSAVVVNALVVFSSAIVFYRVASRRQTGPRTTRSVLITATAACFFLWVCLARESIRQMTFMVMPEGPALGWAICSCALVLRPATPRNLLGAAICAALSVWCKQTMFPFLLVPTLHLLLTQGWKVAARCAIVQLIVFLLISALLVLAFGGRNMWFHMVTLPASHSWRGQEHGKMLVFIRGVMDLLVDAVEPLSIVVLVAIITTFAQRPAPSGGWLHRFYRDQPWMILVLAAVVLVPTAVLGYVKVGGYLNNFGISNLLLLLAATVGAAGVMSRQQAEPAVWVIAVALCSVIVFRAGRVAVVWHQLGSMATTIANPSGNQQEVAFQYAKAHPGVVYFPWNNLSTLLAEGKLYHFEWGVHDRVDANLDPTPQQILKHIPPNIRYVAYYSKAQSSFALIMFPKVRDAAPIEELPGFRVFAIR